MEKGKAVFLDRDGIINRNDPEHAKLAYYITKWEDFIFMPKVFDGLKAIKDKGYLLIIITDQPAIGKGIMSLKEAQDISQRMMKEFEKESIKIDGIYLCPHKAEDKCSCKKPLPKRILEAAKDFNISLSKSFVVGDKTTDIETGKSAGVRTILVLTGYQGKDARSAAKPDITCKDLVEVARVIP